MRVCKMQLQKLTCLLVCLIIKLILSITVLGQAADNPFMADPTIFYYKGIYYLYGTGGGNKDDGFKVFTSADKKEWKDRGFVLKKGESFGTKGFWAPQVFEHSGRFYMAYTANEHIAIAIADNPLGPFTQKEIKPVPSEVRMIDPFVFFEKDKIYLYHVRLEKGNRIFVAEMDASLSAIDTTTLKECISATESWEDTQNAAWKVTEGPTVIKHGGYYYLIYSANDFRNPDYAVGYAVSKSATGPWEKYKNNPLISGKDAGINGTGHGDIFFDRTGKMNYIFHTHFSNTIVAKRRTAIIEMYFKKDKQQPAFLKTRKNTFSFLHVLKSAP